MAGDVQPKSRAQFNLPSVYINCLDQFHVHTNYHYILTGSTSTDASIKQTLQSARC